MARSDGSARLILAHEAAQFGEVAADRFSAEELRAVLSLYSLGEVSSARPLLIGNPLSPKVLVESARGRFLLKRRERGTDPFAVALAHDLMLHVGAAGDASSHGGLGAPVARLVGTKADGNSIAQVGSHVYEMMTFVAGRAFNGSAADAHVGGRTLGAFAQRAATFHPRIDPPRGGFHRAGSVEAAVRAAGERAGDSALAARLVSTHELATACAESAGASGFETRMIHGDWHPGNVVFAGGDVACIVDFESPSLAPVVLDVAVGALQYSLAGRFEPSHARLVVDSSRVAAFAEGLLSWRAPSGLGQLVAASPGVVAPLMAEALITEASRQVALVGGLGGSVAGVALQAVCETAEEIMGDVDGFAAMFATRSDRGG